MNNTNSNGKPNYNISTILVRFLKDYKMILVLYVFLMFAFPIELVIQPHYYGKLIDNVSKIKYSQIFSKNKKFIKILIGLWIINQILYASMDVLDSYMIPKVQSYIRINLVNDIINTFKNNYEELEIGSIISKLVKLPFTIRDIQHQLRNFFIPTFVILLAAILYFFSINKILGFIGIIGFVVFVLILYYASKICIKKTSIKDRLHNSLHENIGDVFNNLLPMYSSNTMEKEINMLYSQEKTLDDNYKDSILCSLKVKLTYAISYLMFFLVINGYSFYLFSKKKIKLDALISILIIVLYLISNLSATAGEIRDMIFNLGVIEETQVYLNNLLKNYPKLGEIKKMNNTKNNKIIINYGKIEFKNIEFTYPSNNSPIFNNFNIIFKPNESVGIIGKIGSGKSTLIKLLLRLNEFQKGEIRIDNENIMDYNEDTIRYNISYVPQNPKLFNRSIYDNIVYGIDNVKKEDVVLLLKKFNVYDMFSNMKDGLDTSVGKNGEKVSGGQRQTIFLLRSVLRNNKILILDEPTSALDSQSREYIFKILKTLMVNRTFIVITHDLELLKIVDRTIEFDKGHIIRDN